MAHGPIMRKFSDIAKSSNTPKVNVTFKDEVQYRVETEIDPSGREVKTYTKINLNNFIQSDLDALIDVVANYGSVPAQRALNACMTKASYWDEHVMNKKRLEKLRNNIVTLTQMEFDTLIRVGNLGVCVQALCELNGAIEVSTENGLIRITSPEEFIEWGKKIGAVKQDFEY